MRKRLLESFQQNEAAAMAAMARRWGNPRYVQDMWELLAKLEGELGKDVANGEARGIPVIQVTTDGVHRLDPDAFRAAAAKRPAVNGPWRAKPIAGAWDLLAVSPRGLTLIAAVSEKPNLMGTTYGAVLG